MRAGDKAMAARERSLLHLYMELTGAAEATARSVYAHVCYREPVEESSRETELPVAPKLIEETLDSVAKQPAPLAQWLNRHVAVPSRA